MIGPDGSLYVVDMYRAIIEDYSAIPRYLQQIYIESLVAGADKGRIWRSWPMVAAGRGRWISRDARRPNWWCSSAKQTSVPSDGSAFAG